MYKVLRIGESHETSFHGTIEQAIECYGAVITIDGITYHPEKHRNVTDRQHQQNLDYIAECRRNREVFKEAPLIGDYVLYERKYLRFTHNWGEGLQTTCIRGGDAENHQGFHLHKSGFASYSGALDFSIPRKHLKLAEFRRNARFWIFHNDQITAHNAIYFSLPCKVFNNVVKN